MCAMCLIVDIFIHTQAQLAVKESKRQFEKLKYDLGEKIEMVSASRCNLLSRSLPSYQKVVLDFLDCSANEFHEVLAELRSQHHHQYKVRKILEEIRDLEAEESIEGDPPLSLTPEGDADTPSQEETKEETKVMDDEPLIDIGVEMGEDAFTMEGDDSATMEGDEVANKDKEETGEDVKMKDQPLTSLETDLRELESQQQQSRAVDELNDLLGLIPPSTADSPTAEGGTRTNELFDEWSDFSAFMSATKSDAPTASSKWEKELMQTDSLQDLLLDDNGPQSNGQLPAETEDQLTAKDTPLQPTSAPLSPPRESDNQSPSLTTDEILGLLDNQPPAGSSAAALADEILSLTLDPTAAKQTTTKDNPFTAGLESLDPTFFHQATSLPPLSAPMPLMMPSPSQPPFQTHPQMMPYPMGGIRGPLPLYYPPQPMPRATMPGGQQVSTGQQPKAKREFGKKDEKGSSWMNVFAHLDPLSNEKV